MLKYCKFWTHEEIREEIKKMTEKDIEDQEKKLGIDDDDNKNAKEKKEKN